MVGVRGPRGQVSGGGRWRLSGQSPGTAGPEAGRTVELHLPVWLHGYVQDALKAFTSPCAEYEVLLLSYLIKTYKILFDMQKNPQRYYYLCIFQMRKKWPPCIANKFQGCSQSPDQATSGVMMQVGRLLYKSRLFWDVKVSYPRLVPA